MDAYYIESGPLRGADVASDGEYTTPQPCVAADEKGNQQSDNGYTESQIIPNTSKKASNRGIS